MLLVDHNADLKIVNKKKMMPLHSAVYGDNVECFKFIIEETDKQRKKNEFRLLEKTEDTKTFHGLTPLMLSMEEKCMKIYEYLLA